MFLIFHLVWLQPLTYLFIMCKIVTLISSILLGGAFILFGLNFFFQFIPMDGAPEGSDAAAFMGLLYTTGYLGFVKVLEVIGGVLVILPKTRNLGLLILGPIIINIIAYYYFIKSSFDWDIAILAALSLYLLIKQGKSFTQFIFTCGCNKGESSDGNNSCGI